MLPAEERNETHDLHKMNVVERPRVIYKYTMIVENM